MCLNQVCSPPFGITTQRVIISPHTSNKALPISGLNTSHAIPIVKNETENPIAIAVTLAAIFIVSESRDPTNGIHESSSMIGANKK